MNVIEEYEIRKMLEQIVEYEYAIYLRKSRADLEAEKYSKTDTLKRHRVILLNLAKSMGIDERKIKIYEEVVSGETIKERQEMQKLLEEIEFKKYKAVFVVEISRLSRGDKIDQGEITKIFKYTNTLIITPDKTYDLSNEKDEELFEDELTNSSKELKVTKKRLNRGRNSSILEGKFVSSIAPYGFKRKKIEDDKGYTLEEELSESVIVKQIFNLYAYKGLSMGQIVKELNKLELKPRKSEKWSYSTIKDILKNPVYIGSIRWNHRKEVKTLKNKEIQTSRPRNANPLIVQDAHEPIISKEVWEITQERMRKNKAPVQHNNEVKNPLVHIVVCDKCGAYMQRRPYTKKDKEPTLMCTKCDNISSKFHYVEEKIIEGLKYWLKNYKIDYDSVRDKKLADNINYYENAIKQLELQVVTQEQQMEKVCEAYEKGVYSEKIYIERYGKHIESISKLNSTIAEYKEQLKKEYAVLDEKELIIPKLENVIDIYYQLDTAEEKNNILRTVLEKVTYLKEKKALKKTDDPTEFEIRLYPKLPK